jgi:hypothetical protein
MESQPNGPPASALDKATAALQQALADACGAEVRTANTGELQRIEKTLAVATEATDRALTLRRQAKVGPSVAATPDTHRAFVDSGGVTWDAFAVHPSPDTTGKSRLPESFQDGWLSFDSGNERRRLSPIPDEWQAMNEDALRAACERAELAPRRVSASREERPES